METHVPTLHHFPVMFWGNHNGETQGRPQDAGHNGGNISRVKGRNAGAGNGGIRGRGLKAKSSAQKKVM